MIWNNIQHLLSVGLKSVMPDVVFLGVEVVAAEARGVEESETHTILGQPAKYNCNGMINRPYDNNNIMKILWMSKYLSILSRISLFWKMVIPCLVI